MATSEKFGRTSDEWELIVKRSLAIVEETGRSQSLISYSDLAARVSDDLALSPPVDHHLELSHVLYDVVLLGLEGWPDPQKAPLISALAVYKDLREPGPGHITLAKQLKRHTGETRDAQFEFWWKEVQELQAHYAQ